MTRASLQSRGGKVVVDPNGSPVEGRAVPDEAVDEYGEAKSRLSAAAALHPTLGAQANAERLGRCFEHAAATSLETARMSPPAIPPSNPSADAGGRPIQKTKDGRWALSSERETPCNRSNSTAADRS